MTNIKGYRNIEIPVNGVKGKTDILHKQVEIAHQTHRKAIAKHQHIYIIIL